MLYGTSVNVDGKLYMFNCEVDDNNQPVEYWVEVHSQDDTGEWVATEVKYDTLPDKVKSEINNELVKMINEE